jgi:hypothetical protein
VTAEVDLFIGHLRANFAEATRVDLHIYDAHGVEQHRSADIPLHSQTEDVAFQQPISYAKAGPSEKMIANRSTPGLSVCWANTRLITRVHFPDQVLGKRPGDTRLFVLAGEVCSANPLSFACDRTGQLGCV